MRSPRCIFSFLKKSCFITIGSRYLTTFCYFLQGLKRGKGGWLLFVSLLFFLCFLFFFTSSLPFFFLLLYVSDFTAETFWKQFGLTSFLICSWEIMMACSKYMPWEKERGLGGGLLIVTIMGFFSSTKCGKNGHTGESSPV
ncbi:hypothetical protein BGZ63DRAFT_385003 [Mariannaea sp. PMI_226]|nr:hypothetical protein BGZ63DRAFT_385003 [Mariannaea sp. PMI_226]